MSGREEIFQDLKRPDLFFDAFGEMGEGKCAFFSAFKGKDDNVHAVGIEPQQPVLSLFMLENDVCVGKRLGRLFLCHRGLRFFEVDAGLFDLDIAGLL